MTRGRNADPPSLQQAKGDPGRRKGKNAARVAAAQQVATVLAPGSVGAGVPPPPALLNDPAFVGAMAVWNQLSPELVRTHRLPPESRMLFMQFCVYIAEWTASAVDLAENGATQTVKTVAGGQMERRRPVEARRERAFDNVLKLSERFGLTPHDVYALFKDQAQAAATNPGLFDHKPAAPSEDPQDAQPARPGLVGAAARLRSERPPVVN